MLTLLPTTLSGQAAEVALFSGDKPLTYNEVTWAKRPVTEVATEMFLTDMAAVTGMRPAAVDRDEAAIKIYNLTTATAADIERLAKAGIRTDSIAGVKDAFALKMTGGCLTAVGADDRGTAYAILEISRLAGVSPWVWWNDSAPLRLDSITLPDNFESYQMPSVEYRGFFINDEDWSLRPWSTLTLEKGRTKATIGAATYRELFKLLLRLRANTIWPAMHPLTTPFFQVEGAKEAADSCAIVIGTSHCEPLLRNNVGEWDPAARGPYNYITNRDNVLSYWEERLLEAGGMENFYTLGMRGIHDGSMEGARTLDEKKAALKRVLDDQRSLLRRRVNPCVSAIPQAFMPYKEVLDILDAGLEVPDDVTMVWCDDNYGHLTRLAPRSQKSCRSGGAGVYYHLSYWGRPHDYLWLGTTQPGLIVNEMKTAYAHNARKIWIANIHDPKTSSYQLELFLDLAWNIDCTETGSVGNHLSSWLAREFGADAAAELMPAMREFYRLCALRRPEHMGWSQVELSDRKTYPRGLSPVTDTEFSFNDADNEADSYLDAYDSVSETVEATSKIIPPERHDTYFSQIKYPLLCSSLMACKMLEAQRARAQAVSGGDVALPVSGDSLMRVAAARSIDAYMKIRSLTAFYNDSLAGGKWRHLISMSPRGLYVFDPPSLPIELTAQEIERYNIPRNKCLTRDLPAGRDSRDACGFTSTTFEPQPVEMLGHSMKALPLPKGESVTYTMEVDHDCAASLTIGLVPCHALDGGELRFTVTVDNQEPEIHNIEERGRTDRWKENTLRNQARTTSLHQLSAGSHSFTIKALDSNIILDQLLLDTNPTRPHYTLH